MRIEEKLKRLSLGEKPVKVDGSVHDIMRCWKNLNRPEYLHITEDDNGDIYVQLFDSDELYPLMWVMIGMVIVCSIFALLML
jgi:hypothetical protein